MLFLNRIREATSALIEKARTPYLRRQTISGRAVESLERARQSVAGRLLSWQTTTPQYAPNTWQRAITSGYRGNSPFRRCVDMLGNNICQARLSIVELGTEKPFEDSEMIGMFRRGGRISPVPGLTESVMWSQFVQDAFTTGNAYWEKVRGARTGRVRELWRLEPQRVAIEPDQRSQVKRYLYQVGGEWWPIPRENVIHWKFPDPKQSWFGIPPIFSAMRDLSVDNSITDHFKVLLQNHAVPPAVLLHPEPLEDEDADEIRRRWKRHYGNSRAGNVGILTGDTDIKVIGLDLEKMAIGELVAVPESRIASVHGVPMILLGKSGVQADPTRANYAEAKEHFWFDTILPLLDQLSQQVSLFLLPEFYPGAALEAVFDTSRVATLQEAKLRRAERAGKVYETGMLSRHEAQRLAGVHRHGLDTFHGDITEITEV